MNRRPFHKFKHLGHEPHDGSVWIFDGEADEVLGAVSRDPGAEVGEDVSLCHLLPSSFCDAWEVLLGICRTVGAWGLGPLVSSATMEFCVHEPLCRCRKVVPCERI